ncbi:MAG: UDP-N-acetylmuramoyl-tripeptide--D-alanyl-D-alanine ligase [Nitrospirae bacterium]|nr:UDP-N-acetylmuramoyl-tripeptide--D-alanyl-D-alanine ligase [Nitrospirota bacterium]
MRFARSDIVNTMGLLKLNDIINATGGDLISLNADSFLGISIDSRTISEGELFIALKGSRHDGHNFLNEALRRGTGAIVEFPPERFYKDKTVIYVKDSLRALQDIAHYLRMKRNVPVIAITGSNGKTTTKELIASIVSTRYKVLKNTGNLNNQIGLPLTLTRISEDDQMIVLEMGASAPGEINQLCKIAVPNYGVLTNIGKAHLEGFKDLETVRKTKLELLNTVNVAAVNADDAFMMAGVRMSGYNGRLIRYGIKNIAEIYASNIVQHEKGLNFLICIYGEILDVNSQLSGIFNVYNILAATAISYVMDIPLLQIKEAICGFKGVPMRLEFKEINGVEIIYDVYNANPASMEEALKELVRIKKDRTIAVLGDMLELGSYAEEEHRSLGRLLSKLKIDILIGVGSYMALAASEFNGNFYSLQTAEEAGRILKKICRKGDAVLIKGSRGVKMEKVLEDYAL